ncbi:beta-lactamase family protein [Blastopirellula sp. JC732]|uniref:Beta-lactamase family protein n=1 Tax=Blastopirellula sediminis TaxID=2894196 RepID=A0A9X1MPG4_9BACT|nr:serine hydrolase domain-containing protein [Blastopirellula sediminis]MCC9606273.1 beta-lactamase family protein [Blastopirellula sediminis]MCC9630429.1 beta-lactamase family protein [Blastopirellula sediminis]
MRRFSPLLALLLPLLLAPLASAEAPQISPISAAMQKFAAEGKISGAVTLVAKEGKIIHHAADGKANLETDQPMKKETMFAIASMTKPITATAVMMLVDEGKLSLDDPVSKYLPEFADVKLKDGKAPSRPITFRDCMSHTAGFQGSQSFETSLADAAKDVATRPLLFDPGSNWSYSPGLTVAGEAVEVISGMPFEKFLETRLFQPLGMNDTTFYPNEEQRARTAQIYSPGDQPGTLKPSGNAYSDPSKVKGPNPSAGLVTTAADLVKFYQMMLDGGVASGKRYLSESAVAEMTKLQTGDLKTGFTAGCGWGLGFYLVREPQGVTGMLSPGTFGHGGAFGTQGWIDPDKKMIFVLMIQRSGFGNGDDSDVRKAFQTLATDAVKQ